MIPEDVPVKLLTVSPMDGSGKRQVRLMQLSSDLYFVSATLAEFYMSDNHKIRKALRLQSKMLGIPIVHGMSPGMSVADVVTLMITQEERL